MKIHESESELERYFQISMPIPKSLEKLKSHSTGNEILSDFVDGNRKRNKRPASKNWRNDGNVTTNLNKKFPRCWIFFYGMVLYNTFDHHYHMDITTRSSTSLNILRNLNLGMMCFHMCMIKHERKQEKINISHLPSKRTLRIKFSILGWPVCFSS